MKTFLTCLLYIISFGTAISNDNMSSIITLGKMALEGAFKQKVAIENLNLEKRPFICMVNSYEFSAESFIAIEVTGDFLSISLMRHDNVEANQISIRSLDFEVADPTKVINEISNYLSQILIDENKRHEGYQIRGGEWLRYAGYTGGEKIHKLIRSDGENPLIVKVQEFIISLIPEAKNLFEVEE